MPGRVKPEPGLSETPSPRALANINRPVQPNARAVRNVAPTVASTDMLAPSHGRGRRSGAPTVDSRLAHNKKTASSGVEDDEEGDDDVIFMEVKSAVPKVKQQPEDDARPDMNSFSTEDDINKNLKDIGRHVKIFNETLGRLQQLGIQHVTNLPELVLVGDQSSGKSSLMSAIAHLNLPRSDGVCTRCPVHIRLSSSDQESCRISLQQDYAYDASSRDPITEADVTDENPFPPWKKQPREVKEFKTIFYRNHTQDQRMDSIEDLVRWAQVAILNHNLPYEQFIPKNWNEDSFDEQDPDREAERLTDAEFHTEAKFSPNTVALEIKGRGLPDLSFYDLPGVFRNARHERDQYLVKVVENLTREYISHSKSMILWAVPMNVDPETSSAFTIIRRMQAQSRTIGVMTKADLLPAGNCAQWQAMLEGQQHVVGLGYYITSRTPQHDLTEQHAAEEAFFNRQTQGPVWPEQFAKFDERCGVDCLVKFLSQKLGQAFASSLPEVQRKLSARLNQVKDQLDKLPELPPNPELEVRKSLMEFTNEVRSRLTSKAFRNAWRPCSDQFKADVLGLKPKFVVKPPEVQSGSIDLTDADSVVSMTNSPASTKRRNPFDESFDSTPATQRRRGQNGVKIEEHHRNDAAIPFRLTAHGSGTPNSRAPSKSLAVIRDLINAVRDPGKPGEIPYEVYESLCMDAVRAWKTPLDQFINATAKMITKELDEALKKAFPILRQRVIFKESKKHIREFLQGHRDTVTDRLNFMYTLESRKIYTTDDGTFNRHRDEEQQILKRSRHFYRWKAHIGDHTIEAQPVWDTMTPEARNKERKKHQEEAAKMGEDPFAMEIDVASHVRGYYLTAAMRFIDGVAMHITSGMLPDLVESIDFYLDNKLGLINCADPTVFDRLMDEEPATSEKRIQHKNDLQKFAHAIDEIRKLQEKIQAADAASSSPDDVGTDDDDDDDEDDDELGIQGEDANMEDGGA